MGNEYDKPDKQRSILNLAHTINQSSIEYNFIINSPIISFSSIQNDPSERLYHKLTALRDMNVVYKNESQQYCFFFFTNCTLRLKLEASRST